jgi:predicted RNase H-like nuclease (RuvC/YqgF family)
MGTMIDLKNRYEVLMKKNQNLSFRVSELEEEIESLKKETAIIKEDYQAEIMRKDKEIGRLMKKINDKR